MKATLVFVPPGGGEANYSLDFELPGVPQPGDYISVMRPSEQGTEDFIVRRTWWSLSYSYPETVIIGDKPRPCGATKSVMVECEFALGPYSTESHKRSCGGDGHDSQLKRFEDTAF